MDKPYKICLHCESSSVEFFELFDETSLELNLPQLVEKHFGLDLTHSRANCDVLCGDCVDKLLQLYDNELQQIGEEECGTPPSDEKVTRPATPNNADEPTSAENVGDAEFRALLQEAVSIGEVSGDELAVEHYTPAIVSQDYDIVDDDIENVVKQEVDTAQEIAYFEEGEVQYLLAENDEAEVDEAVIMDVEEGGDYGEPTEVINYTVTDAGLVREDPHEYYVAYAEDNEATEQLINGDDVDFEIGDKFELVEQIDVLNTISIAPEDDYSKIEEYLDEVVQSDLAIIDFKHSFKCGVCPGIGFEEFQPMLKHVMAQHSPKSGHHACPLEYCGKVIVGTKRLARHIIFCHADWHKLPIYSHCPDCRARFPEIAAFNKHSCATRKFKRLRGMRLYCDNCNLEFTSYRRYIFHMQFHLEQRRPRFCVICSFKTPDINELFDHVHRAHERVGISFCVICDRVFRDLTQFQNHVHDDNDHIELNYCCDECDKQFSTRAKLRTHKKAVHVATFYCGPCNQELRNESLYKMHMTKHASPLQVCVCSKCGQVHDDKEYMYKHISEQSSSCFDAELVEECVTYVFICEHCSLVFKAPKDLKAHRGTGVHWDGAFWCLPCSRTFSSLKHLKNHTKHKSNEVSMQDKTQCLYMCNYDDCEETYMFWNSLYTHKKRLHENEAKLSSTPVEHLECKFCKKKCATRMSLAVHIARAHNAKFLKCTHCNGQYRNKDALENHIAYMHTPIKCKVCFKVVKNQRNFETHERVVHNRERRYFCEVCHQGFFHNSDRTAHQKVHDTGYSCNECDFQTKYENSLKIHVSTAHLKKFDHKCDICGKVFGRKLSLHNHKKRHASTRPFVCNENLANGCSRSFISNYLLNRHIKEQHGQDSRRNNANRRRVVKSERDVEPHEEEFDEDASDVEYLIEEDTEVDLESGQESYVAHNDGGDEVGVEVTDGQQYEEKYILVDEYAKDV